MWSDDDDDASSPTLTTLLIPSTWHDPFAPAVDHVVPLPNDTRAAGFCLLMLLRNKRLYYEREVVKRSNVVADFDLACASNALDSIKSDLVAAHRRTLTGTPLVKFDELCASEKAESIEKVESIKLLLVAEKRYSLTSEVSSARRTARVFDEGLIDLYAAQAMDWALAARCVGSELRVSFIAVACTALTLVLKSHHTDTDIYADFTLSELAHAAGCAARDICRLEAAMLRAVDFNVLAFNDAYTLLLRHAEQLAVFQTRTEFDLVVAAPDFLTRFGRLVRTMIIDRVDRFACLSPWVRANAAMAMLVGRCPTTQQLRRTSPSRREARALWSLCCNLKINANSATKKTG